MADMTITGDAKFGSVISEMKRVEKASDSMKRKMGRMSGPGGGGGRMRGGMGVLEVSRGVEDFAVAGMRGLLNNIPGIIMSLGGGMGLAGAISLVAVGLSLFGKDLLALGSGLSVAAEDVARLEANTNKLASALGKLRADKAAASFKNDISEAAKASKEFAEIFIAFNADPATAFGVDAELTSEARSLADEIANLNKELATLQGIKTINPISLGARRAEEDLKKASDLVDDYVKRQGQLAVDSEDILKGPTGGGSSSSADDIKKQIAVSEGAIAGMGAEMESLTKQSKAMGTGVKQYFTDLADGAFRLLGAGDDLEAVKKAAGLSGLGPEAAIGVKMQDAEAEIKAQTKKKKELEDQLILVEAEAKNRSERKALLDKEIEANRVLLESAKKQQSAMERQLVAEKAKLEITKEIEEAKVQAAFKEIDSVLSQMGIRGSDMLSSSGRIGGSVEEYNSAIATINYQRDTLKELRVIARNTARRQQATLS